jgi:hypothetical protein
MIPFSIRLARPEDAEGFHTVEEDAAQLLANAPSLAGIPVPPSNSTEEYRAMIAQRHCLTAVSKDAVVGFAATRRHGGAAAGQHRTRGGERERESRKAGTVGHGGFLGYANVGLRILRMPKQCVK